MVTAVLCSISLEFFQQITWVLSGIILWMRPANERQRYIVMSFLIGWVHTQNDPCQRWSISNRRGLSLPLFTCLTDIKFLSLLPSWQVDMSLSIYITFPYRLHMFIYMNPEVYFVAAPWPVNNPNLSNVNVNALVPKFVIIMLTAWSLCVSWL